MDVERPEERRVLGLVFEAACRQVVGEPAVQVDADWNLPAFAALLTETEGPVVAVVTKILEAQLAEGAYAGSGVGERADDCAVPESGEVCGVDGVEKLSGLRDGDLGRSARSGGLARSADGSERVEHDDVSGDEEVEEAP